MKVLVIEDNDMISNLLCTLLELDGHTLVPVRNKFTTLLEPRDPRWNVDVLVTDLMLPEVNGVDILKTAAEHHPAVRRLALSALDTSNAYVR